MNGIFKGVVVALVVLCLLLSGYALIARRHNARELEGLRQGLHGRLEELEGSLAELEGSSDAMSQQIMAYQSALHQLAETQRAQVEAIGRADEIRSDQVEAIEQLKGAAEALSGSVRSELDRLKARQDGVEAYWTRKGELAPPIPPERLAKGYALRWEGDEYLPMEPADGVVAGLPDGAGVRLTGGAYLRTTAPATQLSRALVEAGEFSVEVLFKAGNLTQAGPARMVSISRDPSVRNFTIGQEGREMRVRLRTTKTNLQGTPALAARDAVTGRRQHVVFVRRGETHVLYSNGKAAGSRETPGDLTNWDLAMPLMIGNEATSDRDWDGEFYGVTFFTRALTEEEVQKRFAAANVPEPAQPKAPEPPPEPRPEEPQPAEPERLPDQ